jgi:glycosyltransferase involved in cell wall biosynthesis
MNIAFLTKEYHPNTVDAGFTTLINLAKEMKKQGHTVVMISNRQRYGQHKRLPPASRKSEIFQGVPIYRPYYLPWFNERNLSLSPNVFFNRLLAAPLGAKLVQKKANIKFDIVHSFSSAPLLALNSIFAGILLKNAKKIHTIKSFSSYNKYFFSPGGRLFFKILNLCDAVITSLNYLKKDIIQKGCKKDKLHIIHSPIKINKFNKKNKNTLRKKYGLSLNKKIILYYGNQVSSKGTDIILDCVNYLPQKANIKILMIHPTVWPKKYYEKIKNKKNKINLIVKKINVVDYLNMADAVVLPYRNLKSTEANPLCLLEAMACKTPIITTRIPEIQELVTENKDVIMAKPNDPKNLAENILKVLKNPKKGKKMAENAYKNVQKFNVKEIARQHLELYETLLNKRI